MFPHALNGAELGQVNGFESELSEVDENLLIGMWVLPDGRTLILTGLGGLGPGLGAGLLGAVGV